MTRKQMLAMRERLLSPEQKEAAKQAETKCWREMDPEYRKFFKPQTTDKKGDK